MANEYPDYSEIKDSVKRALKGVDKIGRIDKQVGRTEGLPWENPRGDALPLWTIEIGRDTTPEGHLGARVRQRRVSIKGYFPMRFETDSGGTWDMYLSAVTNQFSSYKSIDICVKSAPIQLIENDFVMYFAASGKVLCHYALLELLVDTVEVFETE